MPDLDWTEDSLIAVEAWLLATIRAEVAGLPGHASIAPDRRSRRAWTVETGPGEWSDAYLARIVKSLPAVIAVWRGGEAAERANLVFSSPWSLYVATGWDGAGKDRGFRSAGAWYAVRRIAPAIHNAVVPGVGRARVTTIGNLWSGDLDKRGVALFQIVLDVPLAIGPVIDPDSCDRLEQIGIAWGLDEARADVDHDGDPVINFGGDDG